MLDTIGRCVWTVQRAADITFRPKHNRPPFHAKVTAGGNALPCGTVTEGLQMGDRMPTKSLKEIDRRIRELQAEADEIRRNEQEGMTRLRAVIEKYKLGRTHLKMAMNDMGARRGTPAHTKSKRAPKYRSLDNPAVVWSGRGRRPAWLVAALKDGRTIDEFLIPDAQEEIGDRPSALS
jgi:DNA-binding protein H-NS